MTKTPILNCRCGSKASLIILDRGNIFQISCNECNSTFKSEYEAINFWNAMVLENSTKIVSYEQQIRKSHITRSEDKHRYKAEEIAIKLVGERHDKRDLVNLVRWLILDQATTIKLDILRENND